MNEVGPKSQEILGVPEYEPNKSEKKERPEQDKPYEETPEINAGEAREKILAAPEQYLELPFDDSPEGDQPQYIDRAMKAASLKSELKLIREKLPLSQRTFSRAVHQRLIQKTSDFSAKTITRPSGLLGGGIMAFCGSLIYLLFSKYIGVKYNYLMFLLLFVFGYLLAVMIEFLLKAIRPTKE